MFILRLLVITLFASLMLSACDSSKLAKKIVQGTIKDGLYSNNYFKMSIKIPQNWDIQNSEEVEEIIKEGSELFSEDISTKIEISNKRTVNLVTAYKYEQEAPVAFNPSISVMAENLSFMPNLKKGSEYLSHLKKFLKKSKLTYEFPQAVYSKDFSGVSFDVLPAVIKIGDTTIHQQYYATKINNYMLAFVTSYTAGEEEKSINKVLATLRFSK